MTTADERLGAIAGNGPAPDPGDINRPAERPADNGGLRIERRKAAAPDLDTSKEPELWERDDAPAGSTSESLLHYEDGKPVRVSGPTHYTHLANGEIVGGYGIGTHVDNGDGPIPVVAHYAG